MRIPITLPDIGAARLSVWFADPGEYVYEGDRLVEVLVEGATVDIPSPATGTLVEIIAVMDDQIAPGEVLGIVEANDTEE